MCHSPVRRWGGEPQPSWGGGPSPRRGAPLPLPSRGFESVEHSHIVSFGHHMLAHHLLVGHGYVARVARASSERRGLRAPSSSFLAATPEGGASTGPAEAVACSFTASLPALDPKPNFRSTREGCAARKRVSCTELGPGFRPSSTSFDVGIATKGCGARHCGLASCQLRGSSYIGKPTRGGNHIRSWCGGHKPAPWVRQCLEGKAWSELHSPPKLVWRPRPAVTVPCRL